MAGPSSTIDQNLLPVQAYFDVYGNFQTFIGQGQPFYATTNPSQSGLNITNSTINSTTIGATTPSTGVFTNMSTTTGSVSTLPASSNDLANKLYVDTVAVGISWKAPVTAGTTVNITLSGTQTVDGVVLVIGNTVLVKNQTDTTKNGIYTVNTGAWTYAPGCTTWAQYVSAIVFIEYGGQGGSAWYCLAQPGGTLGTTAMPWSNFSSSASYTAGPGLTLTGFQFSITPVGTAGIYGSASSVPVLTTNASGQVSSVTNTSIAIAGSQITSGTIGSSLISGSYTGITGVGTLTAGTWNASTIAVANGGTGATTLTGYLLGNGTGAVTASATIPTTALSGTITNAQLANSTISGVALGGNLFSLTAGTAITFNSGTTYNGSTAITINATVPAQVYPGAGIANSTGSAWGTSYSTTGSGTVVALATSPSLVTPILGTPTSGNFSTGTFTWPTFNQNTSGTASNVTGTVVVANGGSGLTSLTGLAYGNGTSAFTAATAAQVVTVIGATAVTNATNATTATNATNVAVTDDTTTATTCYPNWTSSTTGNLPIKTASTKLTFVPSTGVLTATSFTGAGTGLTGTASSLSIGGNATTATTATNIAGGIASQLVYQSSAGTTAFIPNGTTGQVLQSNGATVPTWVTFTGATPPIQPVTATVASSALTVGINATSLQFRSATLTTGVPTTALAVGALSLVVPSTATLGTVSAVQSQLVLVVLYNGGTPALGIVNISGGTNLDETTLLSTTAMTTGATSASVVYSASAITSSPFRVVGTVVSTQATAGTWATTPSLVQGYGGQAMASMQSLGFGQTWTDVKASRASGTTYTNSTGKPIMLVFTLFQGASNNFTFSINGVAITQLVNGSATVCSNNVTAIIPNGGTYVITVSSGTINNWVELR